MIAPLALPPPRGSVGAAPLRLLVPSTSAQAAALMGHLVHALALLARPEWLAFDKRRAPALRAEVLHLTERLHLAALRGIRP